MEATGAIHPGVEANAFAVLNSKIFIFGGNDKRWNPTNALSTLSAYGHFERLNPEGWSPSPRVLSQGFAYNEKFYFIGAVKQISDNALTNELIEYDPISNKFNRLFINGARLSPRSRFALAVLGNQVFIHGGWGGPSIGSFNDFYVLDMDSFNLIEIHKTGHNSIEAHVSVSLSETFILFVGGLTYGVTNKVKIFDAKKRQWKNEEPLSSELGAGLAWHQAISFPREDGLSVLCLGGFLDYLWQQHPSYMVLFNVTFN